MHGLALRVVQVDGGALVVVALDLAQVHAQVVTELTELGFARVLKAELECCMDLSGTTGCFNFFGRFHIWI